MKSFFAFLTLAFLSMAFSKEKSRFIALKEDFDNAKSIASYLNIPLRVDNETERCFMANAYDNQLKPFFIDRYVVLIPDAGPNLPETTTACVLTAMEPEERLPATSPALARACSRSGFFRDASQLNFGQLRHEGYDDFEFRNFHIRKDKNFLYFQIKIVLADDNHDTYGYCERTKQLLF